MQLFFPQTLRRFVYREPKEKGDAGDREGPRGGGKCLVGVGKRRAVLKKKKNTQRKVRGNWKGIYMRMGTGKWGWASSP